jgi:hypothetical protein
VVVVPYSTWELETWSVVHVMMAVVAVTELDATTLIAGMEAGVEKA